MILNNEKLSYNAEELLKRHMQIQENELICKVNEGIENLKNNMIKYPFNEENQAIEFLIRGFIYDEVLDSFKANMENVGFSVLAEQSKGSPEIIKIRITYK